MTAPAWLLVFPPLIHSNWGSYYPSTAVLASAVSALGVSARQIDLNERFLDHLVDRERLARIVEGEGMDEPDAPEAVPARAAASLLLRPEHAIADAQGRHLPPESTTGLELATELARAFHVDLPVPELVGEAFCTSGAALAYQRFFDDCGVDQAILDTGQAVGISVPMGPQLGPSVLLARRIKGLRPDLRVVLGGPTLTLMEDRLLALILDRVQQIDAVVRFEGEEPIQQLTRQLSAGRWAPEDIANVHVRGRIGIRERTAMRLRDTSGAQYAPELLQRLVAPRLAVQQARGCYWGECAYCDFVELYNTGLRYDGHSVNVLVDEIRRCQHDHGVDRFWLVTEALPPRVALKFAQALLEQGVRIDWRSFAMVDPGFTAEVLKVLHASGCSSLTIGMESMTTRVLRNVRKKADREQNLAFLEAVRASGMQIDVNLIPDLPTTTAREALDGLADVEPYETVFRSVAVFPFEATRSSDIGREPGRFGLTIVLQPEARDPLHPKGQAQFASNRLLYRDDAMTVAERADVFAAYRAFARRVQARNAQRRAATGRGLRFCSPRTAILRARDGSMVVYDWDRDQLWRLPGSMRGFLEWAHDAHEPITRADVATYLHRSSKIPLAALPELTDSMVNSLAAMHILHTD